MQSDKSSIPVVDVGPFLSPTGIHPSSQFDLVIRAIYDACSTYGFFQVVGHNVSANVQKDLLGCTREFFSLPEEQKRALHVRNGGVAWRGYMPLGGEGTHGRTDQKEGLYFGPEHPKDHPHTSLPLHGQNQFPDEAIPSMRPSVLQYLDQVTELGKSLSDAISLSLGLDKHFMRDNYLEPEPVALLRCFRYTPINVGTTPNVKGEFWGIGEHTDFGLLTILSQDSPGLQVLSPNHEWIDVPVIENAFVINVGDMLDMITGGRFKSVKHRVLPPPPNTSRISFPFFFDFSWTAKMKHLPLDHLPLLSASEEAEAKERWGNTTFNSVGGEWRQYLAKKVMKIFPDLNLPDFEANITPSSRFMIEIPTAT